MGSTLTQYHEPSSRVLREAKRECVIVQVTVRPCVQTLFSESCGVSQGGAIVWWRDLPALICLVRSYLKWYSTPNFTSWWPIPPAKSGEILDLILPLYLSWVSQDKFSLVTADISIGAVMERSCAPGEAFANCSDSNNPPASLQRLSWGLKKTFMGETSSLSIRFGGMMCGALR